MGHTTKSLNVTELFLISYFLIPHFIRQCLIVAAINLLSYIKIEKNLVNRSEKITGLYLLCKIPDLN